MQKTAANIVDRFGKFFILTMQSFCVDLVA